MGISVCMATFNGSKYVIEQINSILPQIGSGDEIIICDDASTDETVSIVESIGDPRINIIVNDFNLGYSKTFERALMAAKEQFIFLSDQDDVWLDNKVKLCMMMLMGSDLVVTDCIITDSSLNPVWPSHFAKHNVRTGFIPNLISSRYVGSCMAFRRSILKKCLPMPSWSRFCPHDYWICLVSEAFYDVCLIRTPCMYYRRHSSNASSGGSRVMRPIFTVLMQRIYTYFHIVLLRLRQSRLSSGGSI
jgi:glycosyltransferase involved in cell wall biosynthesis